MSKPVPRRPDLSELELADRIEAVLRAASAVYERSHHEVEAPLEPYVDFRLATRSDHDLEVVLVVGSDQLSIYCDEVEAHLQSVGFYDEEEWMRTCVGAVDYLVRHDLRLKIWSGAFATVGALRLGPNETDWAGELRAVRRGRERCYARIRGRRDAWWMGEFDDAGTLRVWGVYGTTLEEALRHH